MTRARSAAFAAVLAVAAVACTTPAGEVHPPDVGPKGTIVVGVSGAFTENQLVAEMYATALEHAGYTVQRQLDLRSREVSQFALESGQIDVKPEYLSSLLLFLDGDAQPSTVPVDVAAKIQGVLAAKGITVLEPAPAQDTNEFVANGETAQRFGLTTLSSLAAVAGQLTLGAPPECPQRPFCLTGLRDTYGITFYDYEPLDAGGPLTVEALKTNDIQVGLLFSTDPVIDANGFVRLEDDKHLQNAENITPMIRTDKLNAEVGDLLNRVSAALTTDNVKRLVGRVAIEGEDIPSVARSFLRANGLL